MPGNISDERTIGNLIARYAFLVDDGDFAGLGELFTYGQLALNNSDRAIGGEAVEALLKKMLQTYEDGTPCTRHVSSNIIIEIDASGEAASSRSYSTTFQAVEGLPLQAIACGRYDDRFERRDARWVFTYRHIVTGLAGDLSRHRR